MVSLSQAASSNDDGIKNKDEFIVLNETQFHLESINRLNAEAFGPARFTRAAHLLREKGGHDLNLSFIVEYNSQIIGTIRMTPVKLSDLEGYLLGPIVIAQDFKNEGLGSQLIVRSIESAKNHNADFIILVGDEPYYRKFGFKKALYEDIKMPAPVNPERLLILELKQNSIEKAIGTLKHRMSF
ncbi:GNAT family N-acetyltransferase [Bartonella tamiae]|uniref:N-acetyltransferase domain-containing protein n=1 Tax=Bartonella tamiae Th239 TaxID=1094558 RepID=J0R0Z6_9HYPH|nr:N-acetyltransferase [Bartonella tamiae]EJF89214.1 hypothetical protein ME5_01765 [Bartonella tamiae Th239]EJF95383.1 hypothetical protein MEG_00116 [Bartonella tamiae Th307]